MRSRLLVFDLVFVAISLFLLNEHRAATCVGAAPGGLTYAKDRQPAQAEGKNWCCPDGTTAQEVQGVVMCIVP